VGQADQGAVHFGRTHELFLFTYCGHKN
jgi:hypothetical protein